jgi:hypothetical protein
MYSMGAKTISFSPPSVVDSGSVGGIPVLVTKFEVYICRFIGQSNIPSRISFLLGSEQPLSEHARAVLLIMV